MLPRRVTVIPSLKVTRTWMCSPFLNVVPSAGRFSTRTSVTWGALLSVIGTVAVDCVPRFTRSGSEPNPSSTDSPSSSSESSTAVMVNVLSVSPALKVTLVALNE